ncbi:hypothetical protein AHAS_Ahas19G0240100 [Arachis hypogaea]
MEEGSDSSKHNNKKPTKRKAVFTKVDKLKPGTTGHTLVANVLSSNTVLHKGRPTPSSVRPTLITKCLISDETGIIIFTARNQQGLHFTTFLDLINIRHHKACANLGKKIT